MSASVQREPVRAELYNGCATYWRDFIKAIQSLVFDYCGTFGCAKLLRDVPFNSHMEGQNLACLCIKCINKD